MRTLLPIAIALLLSGCGMVSSTYAPERTAEAPLPAGSGLIIFSTGTPHTCVSFSTYLRLRPERASLGDKDLARPSIDSWTLKSDFADHQGNLHVIAVPAGNYYFTPGIESAVVRPVLQPKAVFTVIPGETVYLGEYYMTGGCTLSTLYEVHDQMDRDMALLKSKDPHFDASKVTKRLMELLGGVPPCDATNSELTCR